MILDLEATSSATILSGDVCILGAGIVGLTLAYELRRLGKRVIVLERGGRHPSQNEVGQGLQNNGTSYTGGLKGRAFGLGGTSGLWGGQLVGTTADDRKSRTWINVGAWAISDAEIVAAYRRACDWLKVPDDLVMPRNGRSSALGKVGANFLTRHVFSLPFSRRNFAELNRDSIESDQDLVIGLNARTAGIDAAEDAQEAARRVTSVLVQTKSGETLTVTGSDFVICAGAIESTRLLLNFVRADNGQGKPMPPTGQKFRDHISVPVGRFVVKDRDAFMRLISPRFERSGILHPRFELDADAQERLRLPSAFLHVVAHSNGRTALDAVRRILGMVQNRSFPLRQLAAEAALLFSGLFDLARIGIWRFFRKKIYYPEGHDFVLQADLEQHPCDENRISLGSESDAFIGPKAVIEWKVGDDDFQDVHKIARLFDQDWISSGLSAIAELDISDLRYGQGNGASAFAYDVYHPIGTTAFGENCADSTVNKDLCVHGYTNLYTVSTAVLPSSGCANPTFSAIALALRLAGHLAQKTCVSRIT